MATPTETPGSGDQTTITDNEALKKKAADLGSVILGKEPEAASSEQTKIPRNPSWRDWVFYEHPIAGGLYAEYYGNDANAINDLRGSASQIGFAYPVIEPAYITRNDLPKAIARLDITSADPNNSYDQIKLNDIANQQPQNGDSPDPWLRDANNNIVSANGHSMLDLRKGHVRNGVTVWATRAYNNYAGVRLDGFDNGTVVSTDAAHPAAGYVGYRNAMASLLSELKNNQHFNPAKVWIGPCFYDHVVGSTTVSANMMPELATMSSGVSMLLNNSTDLAPANLRNTKAYVNAKLLELENEPNLYSRLRVAVTVLNAGYAAGVVPNGSNYPSTAQITTNMQATAQTIRTLGLEAISYVNLRTPNTKPPMGLILPYLSRDNSAANDYDPGVNHTLGASNVYNRGAAPVIQGELSKEPRAVVPEPLMPPTLTPLASVAPRNATGQPVPPVSPKDLLDPHPPELVNLPDGKGAQTIKTLISPAQDVNAPSTPLNTLPPAGTMGTGGPIPSR